jgi:hypothetical protein
MDDPDECISAAIIFAAMTAGSAVAAAIRCQDAPGRPQDGVYWSGREIEGKRCWFDQHEDPGKRGLAPDPGLLNCNCKSLRSRPNADPRHLRKQPSLRPITCGMG